MVGLAQALALALALGPTSNCLFAFATLVNFPHPSRNLAEGGGGILPRPLPVLRSSFLVTILGSDGVLWFEDVGCAKPGSSGSLAAYV